MPAAISGALAADEAPALAGLGLVEGTALPTTFIPPKPPRSSFVQTFFVLAGGFVVGGCVVAGVALSLEFDCATAVMTSISAIAGMIISATATAMTPRSA